MKPYLSRSAAIAAARKACRKALQSDIYQAYEGPDYGIYPLATNYDSLYTPRGKIDLGDRWGFELRGPAKDVIKQDEDD